MPGGGLGKVVQVACQMPDDSMAIAVRAWCSDGLDGTADDQQHDAAAVAVICRQ